MSAFLYEIVLHWKLNLRSKEIPVHYYIVPLIFYLFIGGIFTAIDPGSYKTIIPAMTVFGVTMGGVLGSPYPLIEFYGSENRKAYQVGHIPIWTMAVGNCISGLLHLFIMSMIILFTAPFIFDATQPENMAGYLLALVLLIAADLCTGLVFGLFFQGSSKMGMATQLVFLPSIMLSGVMFSIDLLPDILQNLGKIFPAAWGFKAMVQKQTEFKLLLPILLIILLCTAISAWKLRRLNQE